jgi:hypothetical protein
MSSETYESPLPETAPGSGIFILGPDKAAAFPCEPEELIPKSGDAALLAADDDASRVIETLLALSRAEGKWVGVAETKLMRAIIAYHLVKRDPEAQGVFQERRAGMKGLSAEEAADEDLGDAMKALSILDDLVSERKIACDDQMKPTIYYLVPETILPLIEQKESLPN